MFRQLAVILSIIFLTSLIYLCAASSRGPDTATVPLDEIKLAVTSSLDLGNSNVEQTAVTIAKDYPGEYNINQVNEIFKTLRKGWFYFSDPSYKNKYKNANHTLQDGKMSNTIGMGNCDDFAILMASLIASLGGSTRITFASNASSTEGHAYCELFLGYENDSQANDLINWTKAEYSLEEIPGIKKTGNEVWMNLDWWADYIGGSYFEDDWGIVVWQSNKLISPKIVPIIDTMDSTARWETIKDNKESDISINTYPARNGLGIAASYDLKEGGWVGIAKNVSPGILDQVAGLNFSCYAADQQNIIELRLAYSDGTEFGYSLKPDLGKWVDTQVLYEDFKCEKSGDNCVPPKDKLNAEIIKKIEFVVGGQADDKGGHGTIVIDNVKGVMNVPAGSPWALAEEQMETIRAKDLARQSEEARSNPALLIESVKLGIESLSHHYTLEGDLTLRRSLALLPLCLAQLEHDEMVENVVFSPDGLKLATTSGWGWYNNTTRIWDAISGEELQNLDHGYHPVRSIAFSPDSLKLATTADGIARIWDVETGLKLHELDHNNDVLEVIFSPDGAKVATTSDDNSVRMWDTETGAELYELVGGVSENESTGNSLVVFSLNGSEVTATPRGKSVSIWDVRTGEELKSFDTDLAYFSAFSPDGKKLAMAHTIDNIVSIWDVYSGLKIQKINHNEDVKSIAFSPDGLRLATTDSDNTVHIWDVLSGAEIQMIEQNGEVLFAGFSPDSSKLATALTDSTARIWEVQTGTELQRLSHKESVNAVAFSPDGRKIATASSDNTARVWYSKSGAELLKLKQNVSVESVSFGSDGSKLITVGGDKTVIIWDSTTGAKEHKLNHKIAAKSIAFSSDSRRLALAGNDDNNVTIWDVDTGKERKRLKHNSSVGLIVFSPNNRKIATTCNDDRVVQIWDSETGAELKELYYDSPVLSIDFNSDSSKLATACNDRTARIWDLEMGKVLQKLSHDGNVWLVAFSPDDTKIAAACEKEIDRYRNKILIDYSVRIWDLINEKELNKLSLNDYADSITFSPDGLTLLTVGNGIAQIWDVETGRELYMLKKDYFVHSAIFSPNGETFATANDDGTARIWDVNTGNELQRLEHNSPVYNVAFSPDGKTLATACDDNTVRIWSLSSQDLIAEASSRLGCNRAFPE